MLNKKFLFTTLAAVSMASSMMLATPVMAATNDAGDKDAQNGIVKTTYEDKNGTWTEGMIGGNSEGVETCWLASGPKRQYPSEVEHGNMVSGMLKFVLTTQLKDVMVQQLSWIVRYHVQ